MRNIKLFLITFIAITVYVGTFVGFILLLNNDHFILAPLLLITMTSLGLTLAFGEKK